MENCPNGEVFRSLSSTFDRISEAEWFIRLMEENYHSADKFRWSLNSFIRTLKEIMQLLTMEVQQDKDLVKMVSSKKEALFNDPLIKFLYKQRDLIVHKSMLMPASKGTVGFTRGRGLKLGITLPINPLDDSEVAIQKYIYNAAKDMDFLGILYTEEDGSGEYTCVQREWRLEQFPDEEITSLAASAWNKVTRALFDVAEEMGAQLIEPTFELGNPNHVQFEIYNPEWVKNELELAKRRVSEDETLSNESV